MLVERAKEVRAKLGALAVVEQDAEAHEAANRLLQEAQNAHQALTEAAALTRALREMSGPLVAAPKATARDVRRRLREAEREAAQDGIRIVQRAAGTRLLDILREVRTSVEQNAKTAWSEFVGRFDEVADRGERAFPVPGQTRLNSQVKSLAQRLRTVKSRHPLNEQTTLATVLETSEEFDAIAAAVVETGRRLEAAVNDLSQHRGQLP